MGRGVFTKAFVCALALLLLVAGSVLAARQVVKIKIRAGNIVVNAEGGFAPDALPRTHNAPIKIFGKGNIKTVTGEFPPVLKTIQFEFDKHGAVDIEGLPKCSISRLRATTVPQARKLCPGSIVGTGRGSGVVVFPEQGPIPASSPITLFNGPEIQGDPTIYAHAHLTVPGPVTYIVPVRIETIHNGRYGYRVKAEIPRIAGGYGIPLSGSIKVERKWTFKGKKHSYVNARCVDRKLQAIGEFTFKDGTSMKGAFVSPCKIAG